MKVRIVLSNRSGEPIYQQIVNQLKAQILEGELTAGESLPSIRVLAKLVGVSVITTKRAYEELERSGFIYTQPGKGSFVAEMNLDFVKERKLATLQEQLAELMTDAKSLLMSYDEFLEIAIVLWEES
jgi:GntR family transcriptional regulator